MDDSAKAERVFREVGEGRVVQLPVGETFFAPRFGMLIDQFGTPRMVTRAKPTI